MYKLNLDIPSFISQYWQQAPLVVPHGFPEFEDPIDADELAGLACEEEVSSRVVVTGDSDWEVITGPFADYDKFGESHWQLLVQAVNHWYPDSLPLVDAFRFLPDWRFDDLMVSFATPCGGVGPHIDNYDVFIIQGEGRRRWTVGPRGNYRQRDNQPESPLIQDFEPIIDVVLEKGDILYIPPGFPHRGETLTRAISYSIGFRAPSQQELLGELADYLLDTDQGRHRFTSENESGPAGVISNSHQQGIMRLLSDLSRDPVRYRPVLGTLLSRNRFELDICVPEPGLSSEELADALAQGASLHRIGGLKILRLENDPLKRLFINGEIYDLPTATSETLMCLSEQFSFSSDEAEALCRQPGIEALLVGLLNHGLFYLGTTD